MTEPLTRQPSLGPNEVDETDFLHACCSSDKSGRKTENRKEIRPIITHLAAILG